MADDIKVTIEQGNNVYQKHETLSRLHFDRNPKKSN